MYFLFRYVFSPTNRALCDYVSLSTHKANITSGFYLVWNEYSFSLFRNQQEKGDPLKIKFNTPTPFENKYNEK